MNIEQFRLMVFNISVIASTCFMLIALPRASSSAAVDDANLYESACAACHGSDGKGKPISQVAFDIPLPDFSDCEFASREPDPDWHAVVHEGGPVRAFDQMMPAFGDALSDDEIHAILRHVRTFCDNKNWPPGEFNLPRPLFTEKAYPEDETVLTTMIDIEGASAITNELLYEKRFGPRSMAEIAIPVGFRESGVQEDWNAGIGDISLGLKHALYHNLAAGSIFSLGAELILPTGDEDKGFGKGTTVFEPFMAFGQILPGDAFIQLHAFAELPTEDGFDDEVGFRTAIGKTWTEGEFGRAWTPMLEVLVSRDLVSNAETNFDLAPQFQVALNTRQHILLNVGARIPITNTATRDTQIGFYLLWDWFDGGFFDGW